MIHKTFDNVEKAYDLLSKYWKDEANGAQMTEFKTFLKMIGSVKGKKVLDAGCGTGEYAMLLAKKGAIVSAIDFSKGMIKHAKINAKKENLDIFLKKADICSLPFEINSFDKIIIARVLGHVDDKNIIIAAKELMRVLKPKGEIIITMIHPSLGNTSNLIVKGKAYHLPRFNRTVQEHEKIFSKYNGKVSESKSLKIIPNFKKINPEAYEKLRGKDFIQLLKIIKS